VRIAKADLVLTRRWGSATATTPGGPQQVWSITPMRRTRYTSLAFTAELRDADIAGSIGTVGDALDNALCESTIGLFKSEAIDDGGPAWRDRREVEWQVARWVHWYNTTRLHSSIGHLPPNEFEHLHRQATTVAPIPDVA
jgi:putative transposase